MRSGRAGLSVRVAVMSTCKLNGRAAASEQGPGGRAATLRSYAVLRGTSPPMPELPDIVVYLEALQSRVVGERLERLRIASPFLLRSVDPSPDVLAADLAAFRGALTREPHTLKRALTDPRLVSGVGNAYSDEILHAARLSPLKLTTHLTEQEIERLHHATRDTLVAWIERLRAATGDDFPEGVTAFREGMAVRGRYRKPCRVCGSPRERCGDAENYSTSCAQGQTGGHLLADRADQPGFHQEWPQALDE